MVSNDKVCRFEVGQVLYVLSNNDLAVVPMRVIEEITKKTVSGTTKTFIVTSGENDRQDLHDVDGVPYSNLEELRTILLENASKAIAEIVERAKATSLVKFPNKSP